MATIKVKLRASRIPGKAGSLYYQVTHRRVVRIISPGIRIRPEDWDSPAGRLLSQGADTGRIRNRMESDLDMLHEIIVRLEAAGKPFTAGDIVSRFRAPERHITVEEFMEEQIRFLRECHRIGTAVNYRRAWDCLSGFLNGNGLTFPEMTRSFVDLYNDYLQRKGMVKNSLSFHMRILRAIYNKAVRRGLTEQTYPFRDVYTGIGRTRKRAVGEHIIAGLARLDLTPSRRLSLSRDLFLFSFYTRGMAFVDIAHLRKEDVQDGVIRYARHKTGQELSVRVEPCMAEIMDRYAGAVKNTPYLFPVLKSEDRGAAYHEYETALRYYNRQLRRLSQLLRLEHPLSSYTPRHSWATMARNCDVPVSVISAGMGHTSERVTQIYLNSLENRVIDKANRNILDNLEKAFRAGK